MILLKNVIENKLERPNYRAAFSETNYRFTLTFMTGDSFCAQEEDERRLPLYAT